MALKAHWNCKPIGTASPLALQALWNCKRFFTNIRISNFSAIVYAFIRPTNIMYHLIVLAPTRASTTLIIFRLQLLRSITKFRLFCAKHRLHSSRRLLLYFVVTISLLCWLCCRYFVKFFKPVQCWVSINFIDGSDDLSCTVHSKTRTMMAFFGFHQSFHHLKRSTINSV